MVEGGYETLNIFFVEEILTKVMYAKVKSNWTSIVLPKTISVLDAFIAEGFLIVFQTLKS